MRKTVKYFNFLRVQRQDRGTLRFMTVGGQQWNDDERACVSSPPPFGATEVCQGEYLDARPSICRKFPPTLPKLELQIP